MGLVTIKTFDNTIDAHLMRSKLESEGIHSYLFDENLVGLNPLYNITVGGIKLKIDDSDIEKVKEILQEISDNPFTTDNNEILRCPHCHSTNLYSDFKSMKGTKGILSALISFIFMVFPIYYDSVYKCKSCETEFKKGG